MENVVFRVDTGTGERYVLRLHRPGYHALAELESEQMWTEALNHAGIRAPDPLRTVGGARYGTVDVPGAEETRHAGLARWVDGTPMQRSIEESEEPMRLLSWFRELGRLAAAIHDQAMGWQPPASFMRHAFDVEGLVGERPFWGRFWESPVLTPGQRALALSGRRRVRDVLRDYGTRPETYGLIHADLHPGNVLIGDDGLHVIDFDDSGFGWHQYEIAVALYAYLDHPRFVAICDALVDGYRSVRVLDDAALELLPLFFMIRSLVSIGWRADRPELEDRDAAPRLAERFCAQYESLFGSAG